MVGKIYKLWVREILFRAVEKNIQVCANIWVRKACNRFKQSLECIAFRYKFREAEVSVVEDHKVIVRDSICPLYALKGAQPGGIVSFPQASSFPRGRASFL